MDFVTGGSESQADRMLHCSSAHSKAPEMHSRILSKGHCSRKTGILQGPLPTACQQQWSLIQANAGTQPLRAGFASVEVKYQRSVSILPIQPQQDQAPGTSPLQQPCRGPGSVLCSTRMNLKQLHCLQQQHFAFTPAHRTQNRVSHKYFSCFFSFVILFKAGNMTNL